MRSGPLPEGVGWSSWSHSAAYTGQAPSSDHTFGRCRSCTPLGDFLPDPLCPAGRARQPSDGGDARSHGPRGADPTSATGCRPRPRSPASGACDGGASWLVGERRDPGALRPRMAGAAGGERAPGGRRSGRPGRGAALRPPGGPRRRPGGPGQPRHHDAARAIRGRRHPGDARAPGSVPEGRRRVVGRVRLGRPRGAGGSRTGRPSLQLLGAEWLPRRSAELSHARLQGSRPTGARGRRRLRRRLVGHRDRPRAYPKGREWTGDRAPGWIEGPSIDLARANVAKAGRNRARPRRR